MKKSEHYENNFPLEHLLPELGDEDVEFIINNYDYIIESNRIAESDGMSESKVNTADAAAFFKFGYDHAQDIVERKLKPINL